MRKKIGVYLLIMSSSWLSGVTIQKAIPADGKIKLLEDVLLETEKNTLPFKQCKITLSRWHADVHVLHSS